MNYRRELALFIVLGACGFSQDAKHGALPDKITTARTVVLQNESGDVKFTDNITRQIEDWGRWRIVKSRSDADLVLSLQHKQGFKNNFYLVVIDRESGETLWTIKKDVAIGGWGGLAKALMSDLRKRLPERMD